MNKIIPITSSEDQALMSLVDSRRGRSQMALAQLDVEELKRLRRQDYLEAVEAKALQLVTLAIRRFGVQEAGRMVWSANLDGFSIGAVHRADGIVTVKVNNVIVVDSTTAGEEKFVVGPWLMEVAKAMKQADLKRESGEILKENQERTELILDLSSQL